MLLERNQGKAKGQNETLSMDSLLASEPRTKEDVRKEKKELKLTPTTSVNGSRSGCSRSGRHDLNVRPPAPKAGALPS
jgi:hypothetical protein